MNVTTPLNRRDLDTLAINCSVTAGPSVVFVVRHPNGMVTGIAAHQLAAVLTPLAFAAKSAIPEVSYLGGVGTMLEVRVNVTTELLAMEIRRHFHADGLAKLVGDLTYSVLCGQVVS